MQWTMLKLVVDEAPVLVPDTGYMTGSTSAMGDNQTTITIFTAVAVIIATILVAAVVRYRRKAKFGLKASRETMIFRSLLALAAIGGLGFGANFLYSVMAADTVAFTTKGEILMETELKADEPVVVCGTDEVKITQALPAGYKLSMKATPLSTGTIMRAMTTGSTSGSVGNKGTGEVEDSEEHETIIIPSMDKEFAEDTWGYTVGDGDKMSAISDKSVGIKSVTTAVANGDTTTIKFCVKLSPDAKPGTYVSFIDYAIDATPVEYSLSYNANGGTFAETPAVQKSGNTIATGHTFTITDKEPTNSDTEVSFYGWSLTGDSTSAIYEAGDGITVSSLNTTLKAVWGYDDFTLSFDGGDDTPHAAPGQLAVTVRMAMDLPDDQICVITSKTATTCTVTVPAEVPNYKGYNYEYTFLGWSEALTRISDFATEAQAKAAVDYAPGAKVTLDADKTLFAVWFGPIDTSATTAP